MENTKQQRLLEIFFRSLRGEDLSVRKLAAEYSVSAKSISRDISGLKNFLADHRELVGNTELEYSNRDKCYRLYMEEFLSGRELFALIEIMIGARALSRDELLTVVDKLKKFTAKEDRAKLNALIAKELYHYAEVKRDCESVQAAIWKLADCITEKKEITIEYYRMDRAYRTHRVLPASLMFADHYFYLIAFMADGGQTGPTYFRADRIRRIIEHRTKTYDGPEQEFDEGLLRKRSLYMWPGKLRTVRFEFSGPSLQAVLDKLPTAKVIERNGGGKYTVEAEVYGDGIKMWLLSQGRWVKVISPHEFAEEMKNEIAAMSARYEQQN